MFPQFAFYYKGPEEEKIVRGGVNGPLFLLFFPLFFFNLKGIETQLKFINLRSDFLIM